MEEYKFTPFGAYVGPLNLQVNEEQCMTENFLHDLFHAFSKAHSYFVQDFESDQSLVALEQSPFFAILKAIDGQV